MLLFGSILSFSEALIDILADVVYKAATTSIRLPRSLVLYVVMATAKMASLTQKIVILVNSVMSVCPCDFVWFVVGRETITMWSCGEI